jgi:hypothetical protein
VWSVTINQEEAVRMFLDTKAITEIHRLKAIYGDRMAQTNSRWNGQFGVVRIYEKAEDRGHPERAIATLTTLAALREYE